MYVCICNGVTEHEIEDAASQGARTLAQLEDALQVGTGCGKCRETAEACLERYARQHPPRPSLAYSA